MRKITKMISLLVAVLMVFGATSVSAFAMPSIHAGTGGRDTSIVLNTQNIHEEQVTGVEYKLSPVLEIKERCEVTTGDVLKEWTTTNEADTLSLPAGDYELSVQSTPKNYFATKETIYFSIDADGVVKTFAVNWYGEKYNEAVVDGNILNNVLRYRDGLVVKNETGKQNKFFIAQRMGKNLVSSGDTTAIFTVYNADGTAKQGENSYTFEKVRNRANLYEVTLEDGEYIELYDIHAEGFYIFAEKTDDSNVFKFDDGDEYTAFNKADDAVQSDMKMHAPVVDSKIGDWQAAVVYPTLNDPAGEGFNFGGTFFAWGRSSIPHTVVLSVKEAPADPADTADPADPADPADTVDPVDPADPTDPADPADLADPVDPADPADPVDPADPANLSGTTEAKAADTTDITVYVEPAPQEEKINAEEVINDEGTPMDEKEEVIGDEETPLAEEVIQVPDTSLDEAAIEDEETPLAETAIEDEDTPLGEIPKTGDNSNMTLWIALLFVSALGFVGTSYSAKRKEK